jgi:hypothetical protein
MKNKALVHIILLFIFLKPCSGQEVVAGLQSNPQVRNAWNKLDKKKGSTVPDTLELPFFDDFSKITVYPDPAKWIDNYVFINNTFSVQQKTAGVATFDALDNTGRLYETADQFGFQADKLTSLPINLNYQPSDNVFLSFFYEPGGISDEPESKDSLTLQFYAPSEKKWYSVWRAQGSPVQPFRAVILPVSNPIFLKKGFQFRFINYASLSSSTSDLSMTGNCDIWNIDYVQLNKNRNNADTIPPDVSFTLPVRSLLKTQEAMPWSQFRKVFLSEMGPFIPIHYRNNDNIVRNITRNFEIIDFYKNTLSYAFSAGATNIDPGKSIDYKANLIYTFNSDNQDSALFRIKSYLITDVYDPKQNDTIIYYQKFTNYFAFDDGTAESGYGVNGLGSRNAMVAYRFKSFIPDSLRAIQICFNDSYLNSNLRAFDLVVWGDNNGVPGDIIYEQDDMNVTQGQGINGFYTYILNAPAFVDGTFYVGWRQKTETFLNAGFDLNTLHGGKQLYWLNGNWSVSQAQGSLMIRAVVGKLSKPTLTASVKTGNNTLKLWPNPVSGTLNIEPGELFTSQYTRIRIIDFKGNTLKEYNYNSQIDVSSLPDGIYSIIIYFGNRQLMYNRIVKISR